MNINFLWIGSKLGKLEQLSLKSFIDNNHEVHLWLYDLNCSNVPHGTILRNAAEILPSEKIFSYVGGGDCRTGSYGGFSDLFRYYLLKKHGGWYCDMDVSCLNNFSKLDEQQYIFRPHKRIGVVGNIMKCPQDSAIINTCIEETEKQIDKHNTSWVLPVKILRDCVYKHGLEEYIAPVDWFGDDDIEVIRKLLALGSFVPTDIMPKYALHWCNEAITTGQWDRSIKRDFNAPIPTTLYYNLLAKHQLL
jgi:hypothetical protein